jgi:hypothetical protein
MRTASKILAVAFVVGSLAMPAGVAFANAPEVAATCENGLTFQMGRGEAGTTVTVYLDNVREYGPIEVVRHGDPLSFAVPAPSDRSVPHSWLVVVDSVWNQDQRITRSVPACSVTTTSTATTAPTPSSTTVAPTTTTPDTISSSTTTSSTSVPAPATTTTSITTTTEPPPTPPSTTVAATTSAPTTVSSSTTTTPLPEPAPSPATAIPGTTPRNVSSTSPTTSSPPPSASTPAGEIPTTGSKILAIALAAAGSLFAGVMARRASRRPS